MLRLFVCSSSVWVRAAFAPAVVVRQGVGESTWNVKWGVDRNDQEYDCGQPNAAVTGADYWAVFVRPTGGGGGGGGGGGDAGGGGGGGH